ncbi:tyrosine-type recombinase/integrase [Hoeflea sp. EC-HK425]|uniref:tyrosine-type recombinase/integrase n=1 Tax=Hoeflea sp. EC-HK425 TaxID=2038388 RepID=UPI0012548776|nr:tyrosine-type recombinase/integrase [Hoeflea sp. EC-HK425]VVT15487.1 Integrase [Hoeflea sp. EC-HK425]
MTDMTRKLPQFCYRELSRHGAARFYFRRGKGARHRLPDFGHPDFWQAYEQARSQSLQGIRPPRAAQGTLEWLIGIYRQSSAYTGLSAATRRQRDNIFGNVIKKAGGVSYTDITRAVIVGGREDRAATPAQARNFLDAMRGLFRWALEADLVTVDPTAGVKNPRRPKAAGFKAWTAEDAEAYCKRWPIGTHERVWFEVLLNTGLRRGDAVRAGRQHLRDGALVIQTEKTGMHVAIPVTEGFLSLMKAGPTGDLTFICGERGLPLTKESFGNLFRKACTAAGVAKSAHGIRKLAATRIAEAGATVAELEAIFGWTGGTMASLYTKTVDRTRLARQGMERLRNTNAPHLAGHHPSPSIKTDG